MNTFEALILSMGAGIVGAFVILVIYQVSQKMQIMKQNKVANGFKGLKQTELYEKLKYQKDRKEVKHERTNNAGKYRRLAELRANEVRERASPNGAISVSTTSNSAVGGKLSPHVALRLNGLLGSAQTTDGTPKGTMGNAEGNKPEIRDTRPKVEF